MGDFTKAYTGTSGRVDYSDDLIVDRLCLGMADEEARSELLRMANDTMSVEDTLQFMELRDSGRRSDLAMTSSHTTNELEEHAQQDAIRSSYRRSGPDHTPQPRHTPPYKFPHTHKHH